MSERIDLTQAPMPAARRTGQKGRLRGTGSPKLDEFARTAFKFGILVSALLLLYLLWGLWSGAWSHEAIVLLDAAGRQRQMDNAGLVYRLLSVSSLITVAALLVCCARDEGTGYWLLGAAALLGGGFPFLTAQINYVRHQSGSRVSDAVLADFQSLAWLCAVPGILWTLVDLWRRFGEAAETMAIQRANVKYGATVGKQAASRQKQVFLGRCWEGPFCRDNIRVKCPIYLKQRGPCWWYKEGCMCEERIVLQAMIAPDWKEKSAEARKHLETGAPRKILSPEAKRERCRNCIIYNEHQRQKHKALTVGVLILMPGLFALNFVWVQATVAHFLAGLDSMTRRFSFSGTPTGISGLNSDTYGIIIWVFIFTFGIVLLSQVMKLIEYCCFKLKI